MKRFSKSIAAGMIVLGSVMVASKAEAIIYEFTDYNPDPVNGDVSASGFFDIDDANMDGLVDFSSELIDYEITLSDLGGNSPVIFPGASGLTVFDGALSGVSVTATSLDFGTQTGGFLCLSLGSCSGTGVWFYSGGFNSLSTSELPGGGFSSSELIGGGFLTASAATAVPFELSPTVGLLTVGGIWGVSRLRKKRIAARKITN